MMRPCAVVVAACAALAACGPEAPPPEPAAAPTAVTAVRLPAGPDAPDWTSESDPVATVGGVAITAADVRAVMNAAAITDPKEALGRAIEVEVVAAAAAADGVDHFYGELLPRYQQALVQALLKQRLEVELVPETVPMAYVKQAFMHKEVRKRYDHWDAFYMRDIQWICCQSGAWCRTNQDKFEGCFAQGAQVMAQVLRDLKAADIRDEHQYEEWFNENWRRKYPELQYEEYGFYFDMSRTWDQNTNVFRMSKEVTEASIALKIGEHSGVTKDPFGYHIVYLAMHIPEQRKSPEDPEVRDEIAANIIEQVRSAEFLELVQKEVRERKIVTFDEALTALRRGPAATP